MRGRGRRGLAIASATWVLAASGCREDEGPPSAATEGDASSSGSELDASGTSDDAPLLACTPGEARACYEGPPGTEGLGVCAAGQQVCAADGLAWSECAGQVWPEPAERCDTPHDDDCDGLTVCEPALEWSQTFPGFVTHVAGTPGGGAVVVGSNGYDDFQGDELERLFVVKLDAAGTREWSYSAGSNSYAWPGALVVDASGATVVAGWYDGAPDLGGGPLPGTFGYGAFAVRYAPDGTYEWGHGFASEGYFAAAFGPNGITYLVGGYLYGSHVDPELGPAQLHVAAIESDGSVRWILPGWGSWFADPVSIFLTETGELALVATGGGSALALGDLPIDDSNGYQPVLVRIGLDGTPLGYQRLFDPAPIYTYELRAFARPGGVVAVATVTQLLDGDQVTGGALVVLDEALAPVSQRFLGSSTWVQSVAPYPDGTTLMTLEFSGLLELGPIGVGGDGPAVAVIDDEGRGRWVELLHSEQGSELTAAAAASDGAAFVAGYVDGRGVLAEGLVDAVFVAKLRP